MRPFIVVNLDELIKAFLLLQDLNEAGLVNSFLSFRCMRSRRPFCSGCSGLMRWMLMPSSLNLERQFVDLTIWSTAAVVGAIQPAFLMAIKYLVPSNAGNTELTTQGSHLLSAFEIVVSVLVALVAR